VSSHSNTAVAVNAVMYPPPAFIDQAAQTGLRSRTDVIQKLLEAPTNLDWARNTKRIPTVQSASIASFRDTALTPKPRKPSAPAAASTDDRA
jgi:hypothetical protein